MSAAPDLALQRELVAEAARAPSVHNVQPARWRFTADAGVLLLAAPDRTLPVADPSGHDVRLSLGAAWEGMGLALSKRGMTLEGPERVDGGEAAGGATPVAAGRIVPGGTPDSLAAYLESRRSFRGRFLPTSPESVAALAALATEELRVVRDRERIGAVAGTYDRAALHFMGSPAYQAELYGWMRFTPAHPGWGRDGLNAECMALSGLEARVASVLLRPRVFGLLRRLGAAGALVSEAPQIRSAAALLLFTPARAADDFEVGRRFHRAWLEITRLGLALTPLSALSDWPETRDALAREHGVPPTHRLANVFRVGTPPADAPRSPRLPVDELLVP